MSFLHLAQETRWNFASEFPCYFQSYWKPVLRTSIIPKIAWMRETCEKEQFSLSFHWLAFLPWVSKHPSYLPCSISWAVSLFCWHIHRWIFPTANLSQESLFTHTRPKYLISCGRRIIYQSLKLSFVTTPLV